MGLLAAISFGLTAPLVDRWGADVEPFVTASLLYAGAALAAAALGGRVSGARGASVPWWILFAMVLAGAVLAPAAFVWGLARTGAATGSLLLNFEAAFTAVLARVLLGERFGRRVAIALLLIGAGGLTLGLQASQAAMLEPLGVLAIVFATSAWALDNVLARRLEALRPFDVVLWKAGAGSMIAGLLGWLGGARWPRFDTVGLLVACGAVGYGVSLRLYLGAQREMGAARTGSVFAVAPFVGAGVAWALGAERLGWPTFVAAALFAAGIALHASEAELSGERGPSAG